MKVLRLLVLGTAWAAMGAWAAAPAHADPYDRLARDLSRAALRARFLRVAVLPFSPASSGAPETGLALAERLTARLVEADGLEVVERTLLEKVLREQGLQHEGLVPAASAVEIGQVLGVDAVVAGTFLSLPRGELEVNARLIDARTARIRGAATARVAKEWEEPWMSPPAAFVIAPPPLASPGVAVSFSAEPPAPGDAGLCAGWEERARAIEAGSLPLKARRWAARLREPGFSPRSLTSNPGSEIRSLELRQEFYRRLRARHQARDAEPLTPAEEARLERSERAVRLLAERCEY